MNATIATSNYTMSNDSIQVMLDDGTAKRIRVVGSIYDPHFFGKDVCDIMEVENHKDTLQKLVPENHKSTIKDLIEREVNGIKRLEELGCFKHPNLFGPFDLETLSYHDGRAVVLSEPGLLALVNGSRKNKNKKKILEAVNRWLCTFKYQNNAGLLDIFTFISRMELTFDITSDWFKDLWYPLSKSRHLPGEVPTMVQDRPIIVTQNLLNWFGYKGRYIADKQNDFSKLLQTLSIPYEEIDYQHPLALEYPGVNQESEQLKLSNNLEKKRWIAMEPRAFKKVVMRLNTRNADMVRDYYLNLEEAMFAYGDYTRDYLMDKTRRQESGLTLAMEQLTIKDTELDQEREAKEQAERLADQERLRAEEYKQYALTLKDLAISDQKRPLNDIIYISTSKAYSSHNRFKVGGVEGMEKLKPRFSGYNGRSSIDDEWYYSDIFKVANFRAAEKRIEDLLGRFRERKNKEIYVLHYTDLKRYVEWICDHYEDEIEEFNKELDVLISNLNKYKLKPVIPPPYQGTSAVITRFVDGIPTNTTIESTIEDQFKHKIKIYLDTLEPTTKEVKRTELFEQVPFTFNRIDGWRWLKEVIPKFNPRLNLKYR